MLLGTLLFLGTLIPPASAADDTVLVALDAELARTLAAWRGRTDAPYYLAWRVTDTQSWRVVARYGTADEVDTSQRRVVVPTARVGSREFDSTHPVRERFSFSSPRGHAFTIPFDGDVRGIQAWLWQAMADPISDARQTWLRTQTNRKVKVAETDTSPDFSDDPPSVSLGHALTVDFDPEAWRPILAEASRRLDISGIKSSNASLEATVQTSWFVDSEGARLRFARRGLRVAMYAKATSPDGMEAALHRSVDVHDPSRMPTKEALLASADRLVRDVLAQRDAALGEPVAVPTILAGRAAGVFVHEVIGHRVEGHRQRDEDEGQTFRGKLGQRILPASIDVYDDPTLERYAGQDLNGWYPFDAEGQRAARATIVDDGLFRGFLMGRTPVEGFPHSNGHGRADEDSAPVSRMANTILETSSPVPYATLRKRLVAEAKRQGKAFGYLVEELEGGFTQTGRYTPNAFNLRATSLFRVYVDGRPDERVRGLDLVGTPLDALAEVLAAGDDPGVFNGWCGAESGSVPNAAVSPSLLLARAEFQRKEKDQDRPPLLPRPEDAP